MKSRNKTYLARENPSVFGGSKPSEQSYDQNCRICAYRLDTGLDHPIKLKTNDCQSSVFHKQSFGKKKQIQQK